MPDFSPLWATTLPIAPHAVMALLALALGGAQLVAPKGTGVHRGVGYVWAGLMIGAAISALFIHEIRAWGRFSPIHLLVAVVLIGLWVGINAARRGNIRRHRIVMRLLFFSALVVAGAFTLLPGRVMHQVVFGGG